MSQWLYDTPIQIVVTRLPLLDCVGSWHQMPHVAGPLKKYLGDYGCQSHVEVQKRGSQWFHFQSLEFCIHGQTMHCNNV